MTDYFRLASRAGSAVRPGSAVLPLLLGSLCGWLGGPAVALGSGEWSAGATASSAVVSDAWESDQYPGEQGVAEAATEPQGGYFLEDALPGDCHQCGHGSCRCPKWVGQVDALFLWMGNIPSRTLYVNQVTGDPVFDANQAQTEVSVAPRYAILYQPNPCRAIEVNYFQVQSFPGTAALQPGPDPYEISDLAGIPPFEPIDNATLVTSGQIKSLEANARFSEGGPIRWLAGFRWVQWNQSLRIEDTFTDVFGFPGSDAIAVDTGNNLYGGQLGVDAMLWNRDAGFQCNGVAKAGVFGNAEAFQRTSVRSTTPGIDGDLAATADQTAFFGEVGVNASLAITHWLWWRAGYSLFWLSGVATPTDQLGLTDVGLQTTSIDTNGSVLLHGVTTGFEARW